MPQQVVVEQPPLDNLYLVTIHQLEVMVEQVLECLPLLVLMVNLVVHLDIMQVVAQVVFIQVVDQVLRVELVV
jgi:hypothetical protein